MNNIGQHVAENIIKLNDKQITVFIPEYDMKCYSLTFQDFIQKKRKAFDFIVDVLEQSFFDCGFHRIPENHRYSITTHIKSKKGISITITAKRNITLPEDTIITMKDWTSICDIPAEKLKYL